MPTRVMPAVNRILTDFASLFDMPAEPGRSQAWEKWAVTAIALLAALVRFWGLGGWGIEGDEDTMALPVMHILRDGSPLLPSGMFYGRGIAQLYLMAASVATFGESEWAMRFPSVICGLLLIVLAFPLGRRFLSPAWNVAFVASVAFLPGIIVDSQEARMYIFLLACLAGYAILIFEWERNGRVGCLVAAVLVMLIGIQFHTLAVFGAFLVLFPGLRRGDRIKLLQGLGAFVVIVVGFELISHWISSLYPPHPSAYGVEKLVAARDWGVSQLRAPWPLFAFGVALAAAISWYVVKRVQVRAAAITSGILIFAGLSCQVFLFYHLAFLLLLAGSIVVVRRDRNSLLRLGGLLIFSFAFAIAQVIILRSNSGMGLYKVLGLMTGLPSIWCYFNLGIYSPVAGLILILGTLGACWQLAMRRRIPGYWLFWLLTTWIPLLMLGLFTWYPEPRYTEFALLPFLLCALASLQWIAGHSRAKQARAKQVALASVGCILIVNPIGAAHVINAGYSIHPDHKGAAAYLKSLQIAPKDIVVVEDVIVQTYYLGRVDYWLLGRNVASQFVQEIDGKFVDIYTHTPLIDSGEALQALIDKPGRGAIYVIGSGEYDEHNRHWMRSYGIFELIQSKEFKPIFVGRDGLTQIWRVDPPVEAAGTPQPDR
jgi:4-amino-4-deoxy-L-arabinose transferase-like glycosyltransferase